MQCVQTIRMGTRCKLTLASGRLPDVVIRRANVWIIARFRVRDDRL